MGFPDRIERTVEIAHPPARVWAALTTAQGLGAWFGNAATIDLRPGVYSIAFALPGFSAVRRDGVELDGSFTATVNAELRPHSEKTTIGTTRVRPTKPRARGDFVSR